MAYNFRLESCDPASYPDIACLASNNITDIDNDGKKIHIGNPSQIYTLVYLGENVCLASNDLNYQLHYNNNCPLPASQYDNFLLKNCVTGEEKVFSFNTGDLNPTNQTACETCAVDFVPALDTDYCEDINDYPAPNPLVNPSGFRTIPAPSNLPYGGGGMRLYQKLPESALPIVNGFDQNSVNQFALATAYPASTPVWSTNGRVKINSIGIYSGEYSGLTFCSVIPQTGWYYVCAMADNQFRIKLNGDFIMNFTNGGATLNFNYWHILPVYLVAGLNIFEAEAQNVSGDDAFAFEVLTCSESTLVNAVNNSDLDPFQLHGTQGRVGQQFHYSSNNNYGYNLVPGTALNFCNGDPAYTEIIRYKKPDCQYPIIKFDDDPCNCWEVIDRVSELGVLQTNGANFNDCPACVATLTSDACDVHERTVAYATMVQLPVIGVPDRGFKECCYDNLVLADENSNEDYRNDYNGFYFKRQALSDTCDFILHRLSDSTTYALNNSTYGSFVDFGGYSSQPNLKTARVDWKKVLSLLGSGLYQIEKDMTVGGFAFTEMSNTFHLEPFSSLLADKTVRIDTVMNGKLVHLGVDFKGTDFKTSLRTKGFFGRREPEYVQDNLVKRDYSIEQISMSQENKYEYQTTLLPVCITEDLFDFILFGNDLFISDYNKINHSYNFVKFAVELDSSKGTKYYTTRRDARVNLVFKDRIKNKRKLNC